MNQEIKLPPLPDSQANGDNTTDYHGRLFAYTADQMREYAKATLAANSAQVGEVVAYLREIDSGTGNACLVIGNKTDTDSFAVCKAAPPVATAAQSVASEVVRDAARFVFEHTNHEAMLNIERNRIEEQDTCSIDWWRTHIDAAIATNTKQKEVE